jgi:hypothetical protein
MHNQQAADIMTSQVTPMVLFINQFSGQVLEQRDHGITLDAML